jgi:sugar phosphate isomerase/epimerase
MQTTLGNAIDALVIKKGQMGLSMTTDYISDVGDPEPYLRRIARAGFKNIQWIHYWKHDFIYTQPEVQHIANIMKELHLSIYDIHGSAGTEKNWFSTIEYKRLAGVEIVKNRIEMCKALGGSVAVMHIPILNSENIERWRQLKRSLNELEKFCIKKGVKIAVENEPFDEFKGIIELFSEYGPEFIGLCYDSGHGNIGEHGLKNLDSVKERLISLHLHDNNGLEDQHKPIFSGTVDWIELSRIIAESRYNKFLTFEISMKSSKTKSENAFLKSAYSNGLKLLDLVQEG